MWRKAVGREPPNIEGLRTFAQTGDNEDAQFYVGRTELITHIEDACDYAMWRYRQGSRMPAAGSTRLIQAAPGTGKTATFRHLKKRWLEGGDETPIAVIVPVEALASSDDLASHIAESIVLDSSRALRRKRSLTSKSGLKAWLAQVFGGRPVAPEPPLAREFLGRFQWERPVCLMIDEIHELQPDSFPVLQSYHLGEIGGAPVVPVLAGLGNSRNVLDKNGLTRMSMGTCHMLGNLTAGEAAGAVRMMLEHFNVDLAGSPDDWPETLAGTPAVWPTHLHNALQVLAAALAEANGRLADVDRSEVLGRTSERRTAAYKDLLDDALNQSKALLAEVMRRVPEEGAEDTTIINTISELARSENSGNDWRLPSGMHPDEYFNLLVLRGALQIGDGERGYFWFSCPIPGFREHLIGLGEQGGNAASSP